MKPIPKNLILFWHDKAEVPARIQGAIDKTLEINSDYNLIFADDPFMIRFLREEGYSTLADLYEAVRVPSARSDIARFTLLYKYGGVYLDAAMETLRSIDTLLPAEAEMVLVRRDDLAQYQGRPDEAHFTAAIVASTPESKMLEELINEVTVNLHERKYDHCWYATGSFSLNQLYPQFCGTYNIVTLKFSDLLDDFFTYRCVPGISNAWVEQQKDGIVDPAYYQERKHSVFSKAAKGLNDSFKKLLNR